MKRFVKRGIIALLLSVLVVIPVSGIALADENVINMVVSPNVLNLESNGGSISVHTDIGYVSPEDATLKVNGVAIEGISTFVDNCGNLVVKASIDTVKDMVTVGDADFVLICNYNGGVYTGSDTVPVIQVVPQKP